MGELGWPNSPRPPLFACGCGNDSIGGAQIVAFVTLKTSLLNPSLPNTPLSAAKSMASAEVDFEEFCDTTA